MSASERGIHSDLVKVDAYANTQADYDEIPELTEEQLARAKAHHNGVPVDGTSSSDAARTQPANLRSDAEVEERLRAGGPGSQGRTNTFLASDETVARMIVGYDNIISDVETMLAELRSKARVSLVEPLSAAIAKVESDIDRDRDTVRSLRELLVQQPTGSDRTSER